MNTTTSDDPNPAIRYLDGGKLAVTITLEAKTAAMWNDFDLWKITDQYWSFLITVANARREAQDKGTVDNDVWRGMLLDLQRLEARVIATKAHALRRYKETGASHQDVADALDVPRSTARDEYARAQDADRFTYSGWVRGEHDRDTTHMRMMDGIREQDARAQARKADAAEVEHGAAAAATRRAEYDAAAPDEDR